MFVNKKDKNNACNITNFTSRQTERVKFNTSFVKFSKLYAIKHTWTKYLIAAGSGFIMSWALLFMVQNSGIFSGGLSALFQGISKLIYTCISVNTNMKHEYVQTIYNGMFWGFYLFANIPLLIFAYVKLNKRFALLSATYLVSMQLCGFFWTFIPGINEIMLFGKTFTIDDNLKNAGIQVTTFYPNVFPDLVADADHHRFEWGKILNRVTADGLTVSAITSENIIQFVLLLIYALVYAFFTSIFTSIMFIISGSTAGSDIINIYLSQEKHKSIGSVMMVMNGIMMVTGILLGSYFSGMVYGYGPEFAVLNQDSGLPFASNPYVGWQYLISANMVASFVWVLFNGTLINKFFPWQKMVKVEIYTSHSNAEKINNTLQKIHYTHPATVVKAIGGHSKKDVYMLLTIMQCIELPEFIQVVRSVDDKCLISTVRASDIDGYLTIQKQTW